MRSKVVRTLALALILGSAAMTTAQPPETEAKKGVVPPSPGVQGYLPSRQPKHKTPPEKSKLEEMLAEALKNNADIRVAAAKLAEAEAELNRTRVQVTQKVAMLYHAILSQKAVVDLAQKRSDRFKKLMADRAIASELADEELDKLTAAKAKLAELEAQMPELLGKAPQAVIKYNLVELEWPVTPFYTQAMKDVPKLDVPKATGLMAERLRKALQTQVKVGSKLMPFNVILDDLSKKVPGLSFRIVAEGVGSRRTELRFEEALPVSAILQALKDEIGCTFYVREYGILVTSYQGGRPAGALTVEEFLLQKPAEK